MFAASFQMSIFYDWKRHMLRMRTSLNWRYQSETELNSPTSVISFIINCFFFRIFSGFNQCCSSRKIGSGREIDSSNIRHCSVMFSSEFCTGCRFCQGVNNYCVMFNIIKFWVPIIFVFGCYVTDTAPVTAKKHSSSRQKNQHVYFVWKTQLADTPSSAHYY